MEAWREKLQCSAETLAWGLEATGAHVPSKLKGTPPAVTFARYTLNTYHEFAYISEGAAQLADLPISRCAVLLAEVCNIGLEGEAQLWRLDPTAHYGVLNAIARSRMNIELMTRNRDDPLRVAGSLQQGTVSTSVLIRSRLLCRIPACTKTL